MTSGRRSIKKRIYWLLSNDLRRLLGLNSMQRVLRGIKSYGFDLSSKDALDVFGGTGEIVTQIYEPYVKSLTIWEIGQNFRPVLEKRFPNAAIKITNSFEEIKLETHKFGFIHIDNPPLVYGEYCEHFKLFPYVFNLVETSAVLVVNILPFATEKAKSYYNDRILNEEHLEHRRRFYEINNADNISLDILVSKYYSLAQTAGMHIDWSFLEPRTHWPTEPFLYYLVMHVSR